MPSRFLSRTFESYPPTLHPEILRLAGEGKGSRDIAAWLVSEHAVECDHTTVYRFLRRTADERGKTTQAVVREKLAKSAVADLDILARQQKRQERLCYLHYRLAVSEAEAGGSTNMSGAVAFPAGAIYQTSSALLAKTVETSLKLSGADAAPTDPTKVTDEELRKLVASAVEWARVNPST